MDSERRRPHFLFAPGAGAPSSSPWVQKFAELLGSVGPVTCFDYPYQLAGRRSPDRRETLVRAHGQAFDQLKARASGPLVLVGKSMGGRIGCHLAVELAEHGPVALVCLGYPLVGQSGEVRDEVLRALRTPILFVQGTRDPLCPLERLSAVRAEMQAENQLHVVDGGDHSLAVRKGELKRAQTTQAAIDAGVLATIGEFVGARTAQR